MGYFMATHHLAAALTLERALLLLFILSLSLFLCVCVYIFTHWTDDRGWAPPTPPTTFFRQGDPAHRRVRATERSRSRFFFFFLLCVCVVFLFFSHSFFFHLFFYPPSPFSFFFFSTFLVNSEEKPSHSSTVKSDASH